MYLFYLLNNGLLCVGLFLKALYSECSLISESGHNLFIDNIVGFNAAVIRAWTAAEEHSARQAARPAALLSR
jgi:hypothetical protein